MPVTVLGAVKDSSEQIILLYSHEDHIWAKRDNEKIKYVTEEKGEEMLKSLIALLSANNGEGDGTPL